jgi:hypothetical protein
MGLGKPAGAVEQRAIDVDGKELDRQRVTGIDV